MRPIGLQLLTLGAPGVNETELMTTLRKVKPYACVVDDFKAYKLIRDASKEPVRMPILRVINKDDANWHEKVTPAQWVDMMEPVFVDGAVTVQLLNEPQGHAALQPLAKWIAEVIRIIPTHVTLVCANFAVEHPDSLRVIAGEFDEAIKAIAASRHWLGLHEYFQSDPLVAPDRDSRVGHFRVFDQRVSLINKVIDTPLPPLKIVLTEYGRDIGGGQGRAGDGWRNAGWSADEYANRLINGVQDIHSKRQPPIPVCVFARGGGFDLGDGKGRAWESFDVDGTIISRMTTANDTLNVSTGVLPPTTSPVTWVTRKIRTGKDGAFFRKQASTQAGYWVMLTGNSTLTVDYNPNEDVVEAEGTWHQYRIYGNVGYIRTDAAELLPLAPPVEPEPTPEPPVVVEPPGGTTPVTFTVDALHAISSSLQTIYAHNALVIESLREMNDEIASLRLVIAEAVGRAKRAA